MEYIYILSNIALFASALCTKKKEEKMNFLSTLLITIVLYLCYNPMMAYLLDLVQLPINLISMTICNTIMIAILWGIQLKVYKKITLQAYTVPKKELLVWLVLIGVQLPIIFQEFGMLDNFRFISTDATMHAGVAKKFYETQALVTSLEGIEAVNPTFLIGGYVNLGMLFQTYSGIIGEFPLYKLYIAFDCVVYVLIGLVFYYILKRYAKGSKFKEILAVVITLLYMLGYPLNSLITGFHYFALGILQVLTIVYVLQQYGKHITLPALFLCNTGILLTYNLFAPVVYIIEAIVMVLYHHKETGKWINRNVIKNMAIAMFIPGLIGVSFFLLPRILGNIHLEDAQNLNVDGYIYTNYWSNLLVFIPFAIYGIYKQIKEKQYSAIFIVLLVMLGFTGIFLIGKLSHQVSTYYYMKNYYILTAFVMLVAFQGISYLVEDKIGKWIVGLTTGGYLLIIAVHLMFVPVGPYNFVEQPDASIVDIYSSNQATMRYIQSMFSKERIEALQYMEDNQCIQGQNTLLISNHIDEHLLQFFFRYQNRKNLELPNIEEEIAEWNNGNYEYLIVFQKELYMAVYPQIQEGNIVFEKGDVVIYQK